MLRNKKGISELISYVLLIVMGIGIAAGFFVWVRYAAVPPQTSDCDDVDLDVFNNCTCTLNPNGGINGGSLEFWIKNRGNFNVYGLRIMVSNDSISGKTSDIYIRGSSKNTYKETINTGEIKMISGSYYDADVVRAIKITPFRMIDGNLTACTQKNFPIECCLNQGSVPPGEL